MTDGWIDRGTDDVYVTMTGTITALQQLPTGQADDSSNRLDWRRIDKVFVFVIVSYNLVNPVAVFCFSKISNSYPNPHWKWLYLVLNGFGEDLLPITLLITIYMHTLTHLDLTVCLILYHVLYLGMHLKYLDESSNNPNWP